MNTLNYNDWDTRISNRVWQSCDRDILAEWYIPNIWICTTVIKLISAFFNTIGISRVWVGRIKVKKACHTSTLLLYTDNTEMHSSLNNIDLAVYNVNKDLKSVRHWFCRNGPICNTKKLEAMIIAFHKALKTNWDINIFYRDSFLNSRDILRILVWRKTSHYHGTIMCHMFPWEFILNWNFWIEFHL